MYILEFFKDVLYSSISILNGASGWLIISFVIAGLLHNLISPQRFQRSLGNTKISSLLKSTVSGMLLPICSCGVIPIGISMYFSGAYLGPVLAFMTSTPIINPIAVILSLGLLGPDVTIIYVIAGFTIPMIVGILGNKLGGPELYIKQ
ncbi:MAG: permease, partial [Paeniclostridium sordellii]|nr:permease [Paeniclostridium sordellii]